jgi:hypothetical protein
MKLLTAPFWGIALASLIAGGLAACNTNGGMVPGAMPSPSPTHSPSQLSMAGQRAVRIYFAGVQVTASGFLGPGELGEYPATANGNVAPTRVIIGRKTGLFGAGGCCVPQSAWFDRDDKSIWTCRTFSKFVSRFSTNHGQNSWGNVKPNAKLVISPRTVSCGGVALTSAGEIVADDSNNAFVATWRAGSTGSASPIRRIVGPATDLFIPSEITFDSEGDYIVSDRCTPPKCLGEGFNGEILTFDANADGNVPPLRRLGGAKTRLAGPDRIAFDPIHNMIYAANLYASTITAYPAGSAGNVAPTIFIHGKKTQLFNPDAIAVDKAGYLYVGNEPLVPAFPPASILVFAPGANGNVAPIQIIEGSKTRLAEVNGLSVY